VGTRSISETRPIQLDCCGKSTVTSLPVRLTPATHSLVTVPTLERVTDPHLYLGCDTVDRTRTLSPTRRAPDCVADC
ncbi:unnamed protein product, partial [Ixodes hexagonus]